MRKPQRVRCTIVTASMALVALASVEVARSQPAAITPALVAIQFEPPTALPPPVVNESGSRRSQGGSGRTEPFRLLDALPPPPVVNDPGSGRSQGGASRGCGSRPADLPTPLVPLSPVGNKNVRWGLTTSDRPTFWLHAPTGIKDGALIVLVLQDGIDKTSHRAEFQVPPHPSPAVLSLSLPTTATALQPGTLYRWEMRLFCNSGDNSQVESSLDLPIVFSGGIQRVPPSALLQRQLTAAKTTLDRATVYAKHGIWYDALTTLSLPEGNSSTDPAIVRARSNLLRQANLESAASAPTSACCKPER